MPCLNMPRLKTFALIAGLSVAATADAASFAIVPQAGLAGYGATVEWGFSPYLSASAGYTGANLSFNNIETSTARYDGSVTVRNPQTMLHWAPWGGSFRVSAGLFEQNTGYDLTATQFKDPQAAAALDSVNVRSKYPLALAPAVSIGWQSPLDQPGLGYHLSLGAVYGGTPDVSVSAKCKSGVSQATCDTYTANERQKVKDELSSYKLLPILQAGVILRM